MWKLLRNLRLHFAVRLLHLASRPKQHSQLVRLGSDYGGWWVPVKALVPGSVAYCAGAGEDITFDIALYERGCNVTTFDPTPRAIAHVGEVAPHGERFRFLPIGWWNENTELRFFPPYNPAFVSHSVTQRTGGEEYFTAQVKRVGNLMAELGDKRIDIIKMDIEGAELEVLDDLISEGPLPKVLCVEFDRPHLLRADLSRIRRLRAVGYLLEHVEWQNYTFVR